MVKEEYQKFINIMRNNKFWIYGYGKIARRLYRQVVRRGFEDNLAGFIVTDLSCINNHFCEKLVAPINVVDKNDWVIIAADVTSTEEIICNLIKHGFINYYSAFFLMVDLECGFPIKSSVSFPAKKFFSDNWVVAVYLAAIKYMRQGAVGKDIYIKLSSGWLGIDKAQNDYYRFMHTVELCEANGFTQDFPIKICKDLYLLDGAHRIVLSHCFSDGKVSADVYDINRDRWNEIIQGRTLRLDDKRVLLNYLTETEIKALRDVSQKMN